MARGKAKPIDEKIAEKEKVVALLMKRIESEQQELEQLKELKRRKELEKVSDLIADTGLEITEISLVLQEYLKSRNEPITI